MKQLILLTSTLLISFSALSAIRTDAIMGPDYGMETTKIPVPGTTSHMCTSDEWGLDFLDHINDRLAEEDNYHAKVAMNSIRGGMKKESEFCEPPMTTDAGVKLFMLVMAKAFFVEESACEPEVKNPHAPNGTAVGFGQMGLQDAKNHGCRTAEGKLVSSEAQLQDAATNSRCVAQIMMNCASGLPNKNGYMRERRHYEAIATGNRGQFGFVGCFWQPIRKGIGGDGQGGKVNNQLDREKIMQVTAEFCEQNGTGGTDALVRNGFIDQATLCTAVEGQTCDGTIRMSQGWFNNSRPSRTSL